MSALQALLNQKSSDHQVYSIKKLLKDHNLLDRIEFKWVRAHVGIYGNERADYLAKEAVEGGQVVFDIIPVCWGKRILKMNTIQKWQELWTESTKGRRIYDLLPNIGRLMHLNWFPPGRETMIYLSGHDGLGVFKRRFNLSEQTECMCGQANEDIHHLIFECVNWQYNRKRLELIALEEGLTWPCGFYQLIRNEHSFKALTEFFRKIYKSKNARM
ncbi:uncharacterized protein [Centruroides vittatus]|uniref:uncharacterized protein n=1 Tax=Centruroides vittatus TaxID=120091 RepID=UPI00351095FA